MAPFLGIVALAALVAFLFYGMFSWFEQRMAKSVAGVLTVIISLLVIVIPVVVIAIFTAIQLVDVAAQLSATVAQGSFQSNISQFVINVNGIFEPVTGSGIVSAGGVLEFVRTTLPDVLREVSRFVAQTVGSIPVAIILTIMYIILMYEFLVFGKQIVNKVIMLSPLQPEDSRLFLSRIGLMAQAMSKGQLYISFIISLLTSLVLAFFLGLGDYFFLMLVLFTLLNIIPLGCGVVVIPVTIIAMLGGLFWPGLVSLALYLVISNLDAVIRPRIIPKSITLSAGLTALAAFAGIAAFGLLGVVYGPIIMIIVVTALQIYFETYSTNAKWRTKANRTARLG